MEVESATVWMKATGFRAHYFFLVAFLLCCARCKRKLVIPSFCVLRCSSRQCFCATLSRALGMEEVELGSNNSSLVKSFFLTLLISFSILVFGV